MTDNPPETTRFDEAKYIEIKSNGEIIARVEHRRTLSMTDSELAGLSLMLGSLCDSIEEELEKKLSRRPYEILKQTGTTVEVNAAGTEDWVTRVD